MITNPAEPRRWYCETCKMRFETTEASLSGIRFEALVAFMHYHAAVNGNHHEISTWKGPEGAAVHLLTHEEMHGAWAWWLGFQTGQKNAAMRLREPIDALMKELEKQ